MMKIAGIGLMILVSTNTFAKTQIICQTSITIDDAVKYLNEKIKGEMITYDGVTWNKDNEKFEKTLHVITPKTASAPAIYDKTICVTVTD